MNRVIAWEPSAGGSISRTSAQRDRPGDRMLQIAGAQINRAPSIGRREWRPDDQAVLGPSFGCRERTGL
jgi:hypothetical protein